MNLEFKAWPKTPRLDKASSGICITEKIDGTNAAVIITEDGQIGAQSRSRLITPENDNHGFARWVQENKEELLKLGPGHHYGEWAGSGIQRRYGSDTKRFFLFNTLRWRADNPPPSIVSIVPVLFLGDTVDIRGETAKAIAMLEAHGSFAFPGYNQPEGVIVYEFRSRTSYKAFTKWENKS